MQAIRVHSFGGPEVLQLEEVPDPRPTANQVVLTVHAIGVNPVDTYIRAGRYGEKQFPFTPGQDAAGVVESVGAGVSGIRPGDRVYTSGTLSGAYAEKALCESANVHRLPDKATFAEGASLGIAAGVAYYALFFRARGIAGETVLIHGATGGVGTAAIQLARAAGFTVIATAGDENGRQLALDQGAHHAVDHDITARPEEVKGLTGGRGVDIVLEMLANVNLGKDLGVLSKQGRIAVIGSRGTVEIDPRELMKRDADIRGVMLGNATATEHRAIYAALSAALEAGTLKPVIGMELPLKEAGRAHTEVMSSHAPGKIILVPK